ncbi:glycosyltransferase [Agilicoccus flavus]|uniref:glycosyltransferase n=1 Tax=Agilicoccus flavus TaxID=2775968 RepID=UPI001CF64C88|nr:glycosyltransferase [Agilicoccus flavus]
MAAPVDVSVVTSGHDVADARLHREVAALLAVGLDVEVLGLGDAADGPPGASVTTWDRPGGLARVHLAGRMAARARGRVVMTLDPDSALAANAAVLASGRVLVVDVHEDFAKLLSDRPWAGSYGGLAGYGARRLVSAFTQVARRAALTVVADDHVPPLRARHRLVLPNEPVAEMLPGPSEPDERPRALYVGDLRATRGLFAMIEAVRLAPDWALDLVGPVAPADADRLAEVLAAPGPDGAAPLGERVRLLGRLPPTQAWEYARGAWCGFLLLSDTPAFREAMPSKLGEYLACGLPVVTTDLPRPAQVVTDSGAGAVVPAGAAARSGASAGSAASTPDAVVGAAAAHVLRGWADDRAALAVVRDAARRAGAPGDAAASPYRAFAAAVAELAHENVHGERGEGDEDDGPAAPNDEQHADGTSEGSTT